MENKNVKLKNKNKRLYTPDVYRGLSIVCVLLAHVVDWWTADSDQWFYAMGALIMDFFGAPGFLFVSGISFSLSMNRQKDPENPNYSEKKVRNNLMAHSLSLLLIAVIFNFIGVFTFNVEYGFKAIWIWYVLQTIAVSRILTYYLMKYNKIIRLIIAFTLFFISTPIFGYLYENKEGRIGLTLLYQIFFFQHWQDPIFPFLGIFLIGSILGDIVYDNSYIKEKESKKQVKQLILFGIILIAVGILIGSNLTTQDNGWGTLEGLNTHPTWDFSGIFVFFLRGSYAWCFYISGLVVTTFSTLYYFLDVKKDNENRTIKSLKSKGIIGFLSIFGKYSLTVYICHRVVYALPFVFSANIIFFIALINVIIWGKVVLEYDKKYKGKGSIEWLLRIIAKKIQTFLDKE